MLVTCRDAISSAPERSAIRSSSTRALRGARASAFRDPFALAPLRGRLHCQPTTAATGGANGSQEVTTLAHPHQSRSRTEAMDTASRESLVSTNLVAPTTIQVTAVIDMLLAPYICGIRQYLRSFVSPDLGNHVTLASAIPFTFTHVAQRVMRRRVVDGGRVACQSLPMSRRAVRTCGPRRDGC